MVYLVTSLNGGVMVPSVHSDFCLPRRGLTSLPAVTSDSERSATATDRPSWSCTKSVFSWTDCRLTVLLWSSGLPANDPCRGNPEMSANDWTELDALSDDKSAYHKHTLIHYCKTCISREHQIFKIFIVKLNTCKCLELPITISLSA